MKRILVAASTAAILLSPAALAQTSSPSTSSSSSSSTSTSQNPINAQQIKQDLQKAGFTDVNVVAEAFVVQAKSKDGSPVVMTIGPHGMSVFEAMNANSTKSGSTSGSATGSTNSPSDSGSRK